MALQHGKVHALYLDGLNLSGLANSATLGIDVDTAEVTTFADTAKAYLEGDYGHTASFTAFYDNTDDGYDEVAFSKVTTQGDDHYLANVIGGATAGNRVYEQVVRWTGQPRTFDIGSAIMLNGDFQGHNRVSRGEVNFAGAISATGNQTGRNYGATASTATKYVTYRLVSASGAGSITMEIQESSDNGSGDAYAAISGSTSGAMTTVGTAVQVTITAATEAYLRLTTSAFSGFTSATVLVTVTTAA